MSQGSVLLRLNVELSDSDRGVFETLEQRVEQHPSETEDYLVTRMLAWTCRWSSEARLSRGVCVGDEPAVWQEPDPAQAARGGRDYALWIEVGRPSLDRQRRALRLADAVEVWTHRAPDSFERAEGVGLVVVPAEAREILVASLGRKVRWSVTIAGGEVYVQPEGGGVAMITLQ